MAKVMIQASVPHFDEFYAKFAAQAPLRHHAGELSYAVMCIAERRNQALALLDWVDIDAAREFWDSPAAATLIQEWNATAPPEITLLLDAEEVLFFAPEDPIE
jgi:quinol monooxygenase YgiN